MKALRVLIVEDEAVVAMDIEERLTRMGYEPAGHAITGQEAIVLAGSLKPEVVLMDIRLHGDMDGISAARELRQKICAPVIFLTAFSEDETLQKANLAEPYGYVVKPFKDSDLRSAIEIAHYKFAADREILRLNGLLDLLGQVNQAIMHGGSREELFADVCRLAVERGAIATAWICWLDQATGAITTAASFGRDRESVDAVAFPANASPESVPAAVKAMREGRTFLCNDCGSEPCPYLSGNGLEWFGPGSCGTFPLVFRGSPCGALCIRAEQPGFFREREIALLEEIAMDISYALDKLDADDGRRAAEEALQFSEYKYRTVVENASDIIFTVDRAGRILFINKPPAPLSAEEAMGTDCVSYVDPEYRDLVRAEIKRVFEGGEPGRFEIRSRGPNDTVAWYETRLSPPHGTGPLESIVLTTQDITERKEAEEKLRLFKTVFDASTEACAISDPSGLLVYVNNAHERLFGRSAEEARRLNFRDFYPTDSIAILNSVVEPALQRGEPWIGELEVFTAGGQRFPLWERADSIHDSSGKLLYTFGFMHDISERKRVEHIREAHLRLLQSESACSLAELLRAAIDEAEALTGSRIGFFHFVSPDELTVSLQAWSTNTVRQKCKVEQAGTHYSMELAGVWVDCLRERRPVIHNDYASLPHRKGLPAGHAPVLRELVVPVKHGDAIVAMLGVGNKPTDYDDQDVETLVALSSLVWETAEKKRIEELLYQSEETHRRLVENSHEIIFLVNLEGAFTFASPAWTKLLGHPLDQVIGRPVVDFIHPDDLQHSLAYIQMVLESSRRQDDLEYRVRHVDGSWRWHLMSAIPLKNAAGEIVELEGIASDITERRQAIEERKQAYADLEQRVSERTGQLGIANDALKDTNIKLQNTARFATEMAKVAQDATRTKSRFLANMSHEIRTPLNAILGFSQLLQHDAALSTLQRQRLEIIGRNGEQLLSLLNDILELSKIEAGMQDLYLTTFDLWAFLSDLDLAFRAKAEIKHLVFTIEGLEQVPQYLVGDEQKLRQIVVNLLGNAVKFTSTGSIIVRVRSEHTGTDGLVMTVLVEDTGPGLEAREIDRLFHAFEQTELGRRNGMGTGLGLAISRQLAQLMGGDVTVDSSPGKGSRFLLRFIAKEGMAAAAVRHEKRRVLRIEDGQPACRVLVVDDMADSRALLSQTLEATGFEVSEALDGSQAVAAFTSLGPQLILMDSHMPGMDGNEAIRRIRNSEGGNPVRIIMITASATDDVRERALTNGADDFIAKPFRQSELFEKIRLLTGLRYRYDESAPAESPDPARPMNLTKEMVAVLPVELKALIHENAIRARQDQLLELMQEVAAIDPQLGAGLRNLVLKFDYETIIQMNS